METGIPSLRRSRSSGRPLACLSFACTLLATSCASESRLWRLSPLSDESADSDRIALWPLAHVQDDGASILWPLIDFDSHGFAVRPIVAKDDASWDVLYPLSHFDTDSEQGWVLLFYATRENRGLFPICNVGPDLSYAGLVWWWQESGEVTSGGLFPVVHFGDLNYVGPIWWTGAGDGGLFPVVWFDDDLSYVGPVWWAPNADPEPDGFGFFPLFGWSGVRHVGPIWWMRDDGTPESSDWRGLFPVFWLGDGGRELTLLPLYSHTLREDHSRVAMLLPPTWWETSAERTRQVVFPFYAHLAAGDDELTAWTPLYVASERHGDGHDERSQLLVPLFWHRERDDQHVVVTTLGGYGWDDSGATTFVNVLGPLFHHSHDRSGETATTAVLWPLFLRDRTPEGTTTRAFPLFHVHSSPETTRAWILAGLGHYAASGAGTSWRAWPIASGSSAAEEDEWLDVATIFRREQHDDVTRTWLFPLYWGRNAPSLDEDTLLLGLAQRRVVGADRSWRVWPLVASSTSPEAGGVLDPLALVGWFPHAERDRFQLGTSLFLTVDRYGAEKRSWDVGTALLFHVGHQELGPDSPAELFEPDSADGTAAQPTQDVELVERDYAGFFFDWFLIEQREVAHADGRRSSASHWRLPFIHEYERDESSKEWDLLCYAVHSSETANEDVFSVLGYAYRRVARGDAVKREIFPFITWDTAPERSTFSFLWRLFRYERDGERRGGHVLFVPWGDAG